jgi:hypothetical protein
MSAENGPEDREERNQPKKDEHKDLYHWVYVAGGTLLVGVADFIFLWPENHLFAFLLLAAWISLVIIYETHQLHYSQRSIVIVVLSVFSISVGLSALVGPVHLPDAESIGLLQPDHEKDPPNGCAGELSTGALKLVAGTTGYVMPDTSKHLSVIQIGECHSLEINRKGEDLSIDSELYNDDGNLIATIKNNEYRVIIGDSSYIEKNGNLSTLIVMGRTTWFRLWTADKEILRVKFLNASTFQARGVFACPGHNTVTLTDSGEIPGLMTMADSCITARHGVFLLP